MRRWSLVLSLLLALALGVVVIYALWTSERKLTVVFVVPQGFRGAFVIRPTDGTELADGPHSMGTIHTFVIPKTGVFRASRTSVLERWHSVQARFSDGTPLPNGVEVADSVVALRGLFVAGDGEFWTMVGTKEDEIAAWEMIGDGPLTPGQIK